jgi:hypothetical protein
MAEFRQPHGCRLQKASSFTARVWEFRLLYESRSKFESKLAEAHDQKRDST